MIQRTLRSLATIVVLVLVSAAPAVAAPTDREAIDRLLEDFHLAAAEADRDRYLGHFAPTGVFLGTDDWERWPLDEFSEYVDGRFSNGGGWRYESEERHVMFAEDGKTAWFDEIMVSERWGRFRGTGVLIRRAEGWKIAHYSLTALVPNERFAEVSALNRAGFEARGKSAKP
jgi:hypothetical protein